MTTTEADRRLVADQRTIKPVFSDSDRVIFALPAVASDVRPVSRAQSPTDAEWGSIVAVARKLQQRGKLSGRG